jgi:hypothetical protein
MSDTGREKIRELPETVIWGFPPPQAVEGGKGKSWSGSGQTPAFNPLQSGYNLQARGGMETPKVISAGVTPIGKFAIILLLFALAVLFLPKGIRGWFALIIVMGALVANPGAIEEFRDWVGV